MSTEGNPSLSTLPVELIFYIFRYLDAPTIVRSIRRVCKQFYTIVPTYNQFKFDFKSILKSDFHLLCNLIEPKNVESLTLSDDDETPGQIVYFHSIFRISQFTRLHSLTLCEIDDCYLNIILKDIKALELNTLSIYSKRDHSQGTTKVIDLSSAISLPRLFTFNLNIPSFDVTNIPWPFQCTIEHLEICCHTVDGYCNLLSHLPNLRKLVVEQLNDNDVEQTISKLANFEPVYQLSSLTFKYCTIDITILKLLLSLTPSLEYLRLMRAISLNAFTLHLSEWEKFIGKKMPLLNKFEFFLIENQDHILTEHETESLIAIFRTPFWTEAKRWFVICDYITDPSTVLLYSSSVFDPQFEYVYKSKAIRRLITAPTIHNTITMDGVRKMRLDIAEVMSLITSPQGGLPNTILFPKLDELKLRISDKWPLGSLRFLTNLINLPHLAKCSFEINTILHTSQYSTGMIALLKSAPNIRSLVILMSSDYVWTKDYNMDICSTVPDYIRHLTISVSTVDHMHMSLCQLKCRPTIRFEYPSMLDQNPADMILAWFERENGYYTYRLDSSSLCIWFDKYAKIA